MSASPTPLTDTVVGKLAAPDAVADFVSRLPFGVFTALSLAGIVFLWGGTLVALTKYEWWPESGSDLTKTALAALLLLTAAGPYCLAHRLQSRSDRPRLRLAAWFILAVYVCLGIMIVCAFAVLTLQRVCEQLGL